MAQLHNIFKVRFLIMNHIFQVWMETIPRISLPSWLSPTLPPDSGMPSLRHWENLSLLQLFTENSKLTCFQTSDCTIIHLFLFFSVCVFCVYHLAKTLPQYAPQAWMFECSKNWSSSSIIISSSMKTTKVLQVTHQLWLVPGLVRHRSVKQSAILGDLGFCSH